MKERSTGGEKERGGELGDGAIAGSLGWIREATWLDERVNGRSGRAGRLICPFNLSR